MRYRIIKNDNCDEWPYISQRRRFLFWHRWPRLQGGNNTLGHKTKSECKRGLQLALEESDGSGKSTFLVTRLCAGLQLIQSSLDFNINTLYISDTPNGVMK